VLCELSPLFKRQFITKANSITYTAGERSPCADGILAAEIAAFENLDIPLFEVPFQNVGRTPKKCSLDGVISKTSGESRYRYVIKRLANMSAEDLLFQRRLTTETLAIDDALQVRDAAGDHRRARPEEGRSAPTTGSLEQMIEAIDRTLRQTAISGADGSVSWIAPQSVDEGGYYSHAPVGSGLWGGSEGVALFYGALYRTTGEDRHRDFGLRCLGTMRSLVAASIRRGRIMPGLLTHTYVIERGAELLMDRELGDSFDAAVRSVNPRFIARDTMFDVIGGSAGLIMGLMASRNAARSKERQRLMRAAGDHLLKKRVVSTTGARVWNTPEVPLAGFAHGVAGIALSLARLGVVLNESKYINAAAEAIEYERTLFDAGHGNWADLRQAKKGAKPSYAATAWCHGATGIGLAYLAIEELGVSLGLSDDIDRARGATMGAPLISNDTVCCGSFSRTSFLDRMAHSRGDSGCSSFRDGLVSDVLQRSLFGLRTLNQVDHFIVAPGFFNGLSGIGYELIRLYLDRSLPNVHLLEGDSRHR
jgi:type 2 lantibiotic biosynthesis protein LanM